MKRGKGVKIATRLGWNMIASLSLTIIHTHTHTRFYINEQTALGFSSLNRSRAEGVEFAWWHGHMYTT